MVSVVIVNWNSGPLLGQCLRSLRENGAGCEVVVVDNGSQDSSLADLTDLEFRLIRNDANAGFAAACNQGWRCSTRDLVLFLNPDTECLPNAIGILAEDLKSDGGLWATAGQLLDPNGNIQAGSNLRSFPTMGSATAELLLIDELWPRNRWTRRYRMADWNCHRRGDVEQPAAACLMVKRSRIDQLGGFDERFRPAWFEDVDFCKRIRDAGGRILYDPEAVFLHHGGSSLARLSKEEFLRYFHGNQIRYFEKHHGSGAAARIRKLIVAGLTLRSLLCVHRKSLRAAYWRSARAFARKGEWQ